MDLFAEQLIIKKKAKSDVFMQCLIGFLAFSVIVTANYFFYVIFVVYVMPSENSMLNFAAPLICLAVCGGIIYLAYRFITAMNIEYEITITNDDFDFDSIINKKRRRHILSASVQEFKDMGIYTRSEHVNIAYDKKYFACNRGDPGMYFIRPKTKDGKNVLIVFSPNDRMREVISVSEKRRGIRNNVGN